MNEGSLGARDLVTAGVWHIVLVMATAFAATNGARIDARTDADTGWCLLQILELDCKNVGDHVPAPFDQEGSEIILFH